MIKPSLTELIQRAKNSMVAKTGEDNPAVDALAAAIAGASFGQYAYQDYLFQQLNPETANEDWLYIWASRLNIDRIDALPSTGTINFENTSGTVNIAQGVIIKTADDNEFFVTAATSSDMPIPVASVETGEDQNLTSGTALYLVTAVPGLNPDTITSNEIIGGTEIEDLEHWRERIISAFNQRQAVGTVSDYESWAKSAHPDVDFAWVLDNTPEIGIVSIYIGQRENNPILSDGIKDIVQSYIDTVRLAGCHAFVNNPLSKPINIDINGVEDQTLRDQITIALQDLFKEKMDSRDSLTPSEIMLAITDITNSFGLSSPTQIQTPAENEIFILGEISWA